MSTLTPPPKTRLTYREMTVDEKRTQFGEHDPAYRIYLVYPSKAHESIGYVYQKALGKSGKIWRDTGYAQAWVAVGIHGHMGDHPAGDYYPTRSLAADGVHRYWWRLQGQYELTDAPYAPKEGHCPTK